MKYFIDFEATQYTHEIISVGCVREDGVAFYSIVNVKRSHMSNFITKLTGITKEAVAEAPSSDEVFQKFYHWIENDSNLEFLCYGDTDIEFIKANLLRTTDPQAAAALGLIRTNLIDYSQQVKEYFGLHKSIALRRLVAYYRGVESVEQSHNALEDSFFLKEVYDHIAVETPDRNAFPEYRVDEISPKTLTQLSKKKKKALSLADQMEADKVDIGLVRYSKTHSDEWACGNLYTAIMRCIKKMKQKHPEIKQDITILYPTLRKEILAAIKNDTKYCKYFWRKEDEE